MDITVDFVKFKGCNDLSTDDEEYNLVFLKIGFKICIWRLLRYSRNKVLV